MSSSPTADVLRPAGALLAVALSIAGCAHRETVVTRYTMTPSASRSWVGVRVEDVLERWGQPAEKAPDGEGGTILTYKTKPKVEISTRASEPGTMRNAGEPGSGYPPMAGNELETRTPPKPSATFYVSAKGIVYRYTFSPEFLASGKAPEPPLPAEKETGP
jgi:hypothetical protein